MMRGRNLPRRLAILAPLLLAALSLALAMAPPARGAAPPPPGETAGAGVLPLAAGGNVLVLGGARGDGDDARGLRLTLVVALGLALGCGAVAQYQAVSGGRRLAPATLVSLTDPRALAMSREDHDIEHGVDPPAEPSRSQPLGGAGADAPDTAPTPALRHRPSAGNRERTARLVPPARPERGAADERPTPARVQCARAVAAAFVYDRAATVHAFTAALDHDPDVQPAATPGFWDMPSSGHADLARAYLRRDRPLDARSVLTVALLTFEHSRELEALLRETVPSWRS